ncbi:CynX/NimT family MFS transporter [Ureibacillus manganicus]|uniref:Transporter n=1 Tax=Ureibacillus manganicus DSM 26584 TaxID=1384049 RepID=A0A0A3I938_9BACL|nr:MFS transporter [Ureibacillus manganicus]KGR79268.1 transporter [Ureibacillus manganicus DSM 26584]
MASYKSTNQQKKLQITFSTILFIIAIIFFASTLRTPLTGVGPIISYIRESLGISNVLAGFLTTIPLLAFALISPFAPKIARKLSMEFTLFYSVILLTFGIIVRSLGSTSNLIIGTILIGVAIAFGNVLIPGLLKLKYPNQTGLFTGIYTVSMNVTAGIGLGISQPIASNPTFGWQGALASTAVLTIITLLVWFPQLKGKKIDLNNVNNTSVKDNNKKLWRSPLAWAIALTMGFQSLLFYCTTTWLPEILISQGFSAESAGWMTSISQYSQIPMTFLIPIFAEKLKSQRSIVWMFSIFYLIAFIGIYFKITNLTLVWMISLGIASGASFGLCMMLFILRTRTAYEASQISGFAQSTGYLLAAAGPVLFGYLHDVTYSWSLPITLFIIVSILLFVSALISSKNSYI